MSKVRRSHFYRPVIFWCAFLRLASLTGVAQQDFSFTSRAALPDAPAPAQNLPSATDASQQVAAATITVTVLDSNHEVLPGRR